MRHLITILIVTFSFWAGAAYAQSCGGQDLRPVLSEVAKDEVAARLSDVPYPVGNRWIARKDSRQIDLIGTLHINDPRLVERAENLRDTIADADVLLVEATEADLVQLQRDITTTPGLAFIADGPTLPEALSEEDWQTVREAAVSRGIPGFMAAKFQPWFLSLSLAIPSCITQMGPDGQLGLDKRLMQMANGAGVATRSLEDPLDVLKLFAAEPFERQLEYLLISVQSDQNAEDGLATLMAQYFDEEHTAAVEVARVITRDSFPIEPKTFDLLYDEIMAQLLDARNLNWMDRIDAATEDRIAIAVGAAHLGGEQGLLNLLARRGWDLQRAAF